MALRQCGSCGAELNDEMERCPDCGQPVSQETTEQTAVGTRPEQEVEVSEPVQEEAQNKGDKDGKKKKIAVLAGVAVAVVAVIVAIIVGISQSNAAKRAEAYGDNLEQASYKMLSGCADAEGAGNLIKQVWYDSIHEEFNAETYKYTKESNGTGQFYDDFNDALRALFRDSTFQSKISKIRDNQEEVNGLMKELRDPPEKYEEAYDQIKAYYDVYLEFTDMVIDPTGSLTSFSSAFNDADSRAVKAYRMMKLYMDD